MNKNSFLPVDIDISPLNSGTTFPRRTKTGNDREDLWFSMPKLRAKIRCATND